MHPSSARGVLGDRHSDESEVVLRGVCIVEIVWLVADAASYADTLDEAEPWPV